MFPLYKQTAEKSVSVSSLLLSECQNLHSDIFCVQQLAYSVVGVQGKQFPTPLLGQRPQWTEEVQLIVKNDFFFVKCSHFSKSLS